MQHLSSSYKGEDVADEANTKDLLQRRAKELMWTRWQAGDSTYPDGENYHVSHETIYRSLCIQARRALKNELLQHLRRTRMMRL